MKRILRPIVAVVAIPLMILGLIGAALWIACDGDAKPFNKEYDQ